MRTRLFALTLLLCACQTRLCRNPPAPPPPPPWVSPEYVAPKVSAPPVIDGDLSDEAWKQAEWTRPWQKSMALEDARQSTRAKLVWDDAALYVAFEVQDDDIVTPYLNDDDPLYQSEVVEIFLDANDDGATYNELELSPADKVFDASFTARRTNMNTAWSSGMRHAVKLDGTLNTPGDKDRGWTAEMAIPYTNLMLVPHVPPLAGDVWRMNLFRLDVTGANTDGMAFSPVMIGDFHNLPKYGHLRFKAP